MVCGDLIHVDEKAQWFKGIGIRHISCGKKADQVEELKEKAFEATVQGNLDGAREFARKILDIQPNEEELFSLAQSVYDKFDFEGAIALYDKILEKNPKHIGTLMSNASALRYLGKYNEAIRIYNKIIKIQPKNIDALWCKAFMYIYEIRDNKKAIPIVKKILKISPKSVDLFAECAVKFAACGEYEPAVKLANKILDMKPDIIGVRMSKLYWLISLMQEQKTEKDALAIINKYLKNDPKFFVYLLKYRFYVRAEKDDSAVEVYLRIINEEPETDVDRVIKSNTLATMKDHEATIKFCEDNEDRDEIFTHLQITKAVAYKNQGKLVKAIEIFAQVQRKYDEEGSRDIYVLREISKICEKLGDEKRALIFYQRILKFDGEDKEILVKVVHLLKKSHRFDELFSYLERMHRLWPSNNNFMMEYANALMEKNEYPQALALYTQIAEQRGPGDETYDDAKIASLKMGECMLRMGDAPTAYKIFRELVRDDSKFKEAWDGLAMAATKLGKRSEAEKAIKKAANLQKYEFARDTIEPERIEGMPLAPISPKGTRERSISRGKNVIQKPTFRYNPTTKMADSGVEKTLVSNVDSLVNGDGGVVHIGITEEKPTGLFNDLKLFPKKQRTQEEFEKKLRETLQTRLSDSYIWRDIRITFPKMHSVIICEIFVPKSSVPVYVMTKNRDEEFYVRENGKLARLGPRKQSEYIKEHFFDIDD